MKIISSRFSIPKSNDIHGDWNFIYTSDVKSISNNIVLIVVFITGFCVLVIEITALRVLSPYFGNTIFSATSVISVILAALSFGYYFGGRYADKYPYEKVFYSLIFASGLLTLVSQFLASVVLPQFAYRVDLKFGPLISSFLLFALPAYVLGMLSPFAIKLQEKLHPKDGIGTLAGNIFFASTVGSILGSFMTGFYLIPNFGISTIVLSVGVVLSVLGLLGLASGMIKKKTLSVLIIIFALGFSITLTFTQSFSNPDILYSEDGVYEKLVIIDSELDGRPARRFFQDRTSSSALYTDTDELAYDYTKYYSVYKTVKPEIDTALVLGGGAYTVPKILLNDNENLTVDVVEIEPSLFEISQKYFGVPNDGRITNLVQDGRRYLHDTDRTYDLIFSDVYFSIASVPTHFTTVEFFEQAKNRLTEDGVFIANIIGQVSRKSPNFLMSEIKTFQTAFPNSHFFAVNSPFSLNQQNVIFVGARDGVEIDYSRFPVDRGIVLTDHELDVSRYNLSDQLLFTDNYAPIEGLSVDLINTIGKDFDTKISGDEALALIEGQLAYSPRSIGTKGHSLVSEFIQKEVSLYADEIELQKWTQGSYEFTNIVTRFNKDASRRIILGTHYDPKRFADRDKDISKRNLEVPGANDSASGTALLIEIARILHLDQSLSDVGVDIVFFDGEEGLTDFDGSSWRPEGSVYFGGHITEFYPKDLPESGIVVDMVCDRDLELPIEKNSYEANQQLLEEIYSIGIRNYPDVFLAESQFTIHDDHVALIDAGIPSILLIDFNYPYFHTTKDTTDKCSSESLETVGDVLLTYLRSL